MKSLSYLATLSQQTFPVGIWTAVKSIISAPLVLTELPICHWITVKDTSNVLQGNQNKSLTTAVKDLHLHFTIERVAKTIVLDVQKKVFIVVSMCNFYV